ncbi:glycosyltransferase family 117 protein [Bergeyella zoohelcum]|uniref:Uncharacterized protein n=1 Tax=Bergeyella zoohelcum ATCC 43767 TaxID=883096 RepID=K1LSG3_9FLAO|nr:DUF2723 domain-containing protein [Bergeyella zoohelcum]EKB57831.1 hypothetical protein HMPREF9699_00816 [Bergeyella zoohelcum ATCC 43767]SUV48999.1 Protein of uncharacterised function (DUF2723) [Bergeyella zoohelcum]
MKNLEYKKWNNIIGWAIFLIAFTVYGLTAESKFSFWDTGEYIASAVKLEVTHAPGAALFQLAGAVAGLFAFGNPENYGLVINLMSAFFSALTVLLLFWTVTNLSSQYIFKNQENKNPLPVFLAGIIGALGFAFTDTFWYSAVEGEVYSMASLFIALMLWLITKWDIVADENGNERWLVLIFFLLGLSVGVHMMCMLAVPAVCLIYYARKYSFTWKSFAIANIATLFVLAFVFKIIFPLVMTVFGKTEIFFVNGIGLPFHSGTIIAFIVLFGLCFWLIRFAQKKRNNLLKTAVLSLVYMLIGFSCWLVIPIRANANPPMNLNNPDNAIGMLDYYNREQYGDWPTLYGQNYTAHLDYNGILRNDDGSYKIKTTGTVYEKDEKSGKYLAVGERFNYVYHPDHISFMPRMFNEKKEVMANYISMYGAPEFSLNTDNPDVYDSEEANQVFQELQKKFQEGNMKVQDYLDVKPYDLVKVHKPSFVQNMTYFIDFQVGYYFIRYLMWNFVGKQNDMDSAKDDAKGNWISGFSFLDDYRLGNQDELPAKYTNASTTKFYFLPLILGIIGFFFYSNRDFSRNYALLSVFVLTSIGIIFYTGVKPFEPRDRDYAMVGSFYIVGIWMGLGALAVMEFISKKTKKENLSLGAGTLLLGIPLMMGFQNYNAHDRSGRTAAYDYAYSSLVGLPKNAILFVYGDNDTYPVWAIQETEEFRSDVKVVNWELVSTPWNIAQNLRKTYHAAAIPTTLKYEDYREGTNNQIVVFDAKSLKNFIDNKIAEGESPQKFAFVQKYIEHDQMTGKQALQFLKTKSPEKDEMLKMLFGEDRYERYNFLPVSRFVIPVNKANAVKAGILKAEDMDKADDQIVIHYQASTMFKNSLILFDMLSTFDWSRAIQFSNGGIYSEENTLYLHDYLQFDGFNYRLTPIRTEMREDGEMGRTDANELYTTIKKFKWGGFRDTNVHFDESALSNIYSYRNIVGRAAESLVKMGQKAKAIEILDEISKEIPAAKYDDPRSMSFIINGYIMAGQEQKGLKLAETQLKNILKEYNFYMNLPENRRRFSKREIRTKAAEYAMVVAAVSDAYKNIDKKDKGYAYIIKSLEPIDKRFNDFVKDLEQMGVEKAHLSSDEVQLITPFYSNMFDVVTPYDSTFAKEKEDQIMKAIIRVTGN